VEKLLLEGTILWDSVEMESVQSPSELLHRIHATQDELRKTVGDMSFHAQHALLWHYVAATLPDLDKFPADVTKEFCGDYYAYNIVNAPNANKRIGYECFHGMGHAIYYVVVRQQLYQQQASKGLSARIQFRPSAGLVLTPESWCKIYKYCQTDLDQVEGYTEDVADRCIGGARHSVRIFAPDDDMRWHHSTPTKERNEYFDLEMEKCRAQDN
jgi:hypothetical protein